jgi:hypothetical protein
MEQPKKRGRPKKTEEEKQRTVNKMKRRHYYRKKKELRQYIYKTEIKVSNEILKLNEDYNKIELLYNDNE